MAKNELIIDLTQAKTSLTFVEGDRPVHGVTLNTLDVEQAITDWITENTEWAKFFEGTPI